MGFELESELDFSLLRLEFRFRTMVFLCYLVVTSCFCVGRVFWLASLLLLNDFWCQLMRDKSADKTLRLTGKRKTIFTMIGKQFILLNDLYVI
jgi:hypothetical protein